MTKKTELDYFSLTAIPIKAKKGEATLGPATGFFYAFDNKLFLISNWHVFAGRNPYTGQPLLENGAIPDRIEHPLHLKKLGAFSRKNGSFLGNEDDETIWMQHPKGQEIDLGAIYLHDIPEKFEVYPANPPDQASEDVELRVADEVFITGFPLGLSKQGVIPVWKKGTVASEPNLPMDDNSPTFLVDTASREGMSGSPVFLRSNSGILSHAGGDISFSRGPRTKLVGVYSGRFGVNDEMAAQLGRVWHVAAIEEMLSSPRRGSYEISKVP